MNVNLILGQITYVYRPLTANVVNVSLNFGC